MNAYKNTLLSSFVAASLGVVGVAAANDQEPMAERSVGTVIDDATITASVKASLLDDDRTEGFDINVDTLNGHVTLRGGTDSGTDRDLAGQLALDVDGVRTVDNQLVVARKGTEARAAANQATASGEAREAVSDAGEVMSDAWITSKVKAMLLADNDISGLAISVETMDKVVHLTGDVPSKTVRAEAIRIAETTEGVASVNAERLMVGPKAAMR